MTKIEVVGYGIILRVNDVGLILTGSQLHDIKVALDEFYDIHKRSISYLAQTHEEDSAACAGGGED